ncbi:SDR family NAD(P)-dependent oxidoreductase [Roseomonas elaeocarpi]|uniref:SDR family NAD(P)-dependent oxidoreductase n=1 Tax=Roseomonas elaeocarpi TaxID=907779 RepID=A0ABV6JS87_9PROT
MNHLQAASLTGQVALVTGAQQGIGRAAALALGTAGADVAVNFLDDPATAEAVCQELRALGRRAVAVRADVSRTDEVARMVADAEAALGTVTVLVNNAGIFPRVNFLDMTEAQWDAVLSVNLKGTAFTAQAVARRLVATGQPGAIVNLSSAAVRGAPLGPHYSATKAGIIGLTRSLSQSLAPHRIRVNAVAPGLTDTAQPRYGNDEAELAEMARAIPLGRMGQPEEIANLIAFLCSPGAAWVTGQCWHINGGAYLQ